MYDKVFVHLWMHLPKNERGRIAYVFDLNRSGISEVKDEQVITDGYCQADLLGITAEKMEEYVGSKESFNRLWELTCAKAHSECNPPVGVIVRNEDGDPEIKEVPPMNLKPQPEAVLDSTEDVEKPIKTRKPRKNAKNTKA